MRISNGLTVNTYLRNLDTISNDKYKNEIRLSTGKNIVNLSDAPEKLVKVKNMDYAIAENNNYRYIIDQSVRELATTEDRIQAISDKIAEIRQQAIDSTHAGSSGNSFSIGVYIKGLIEDVLKDANSDFNGKLLFSGTKTTSESIVPTPPQQNSLPFEMLYNEPTADNPSGMQIVFKGNFNDRIINKDSKTTEIVNATADKMFGNNGSEFFNDIIKIYNILTYKPDGTTRDIGDMLSKDEIAEIGVYQAKLAVHNESLTNLTAQMAARRARMESISIQMSEETLRYKEMKTINEDTDYAKTTMDLKLEDMALQYTLKVGSNLLQTTLLDFLS